MKTITWHGVLQFLATAVQILNAVTAFVPSKDKVYVGAATGIIQVVLHQYALNQAPPVPPVQ